MEPINEKPKRDFLLPTSILLSALIVSLALVYNAGKRAGNDGGDLSANISATAAAALEETKALSDDDHLRGDAKAPIVAIAFSDFECPFCKVFHETMNQILAAYPGKVAFAYRHFPLDQIHPKTEKEAEASECAVELGGNEAFWSYADRLFAITPSNNGLDPAELPRIATYIGLKKADFESCLASGRKAADVASDAKDGAAAGAQGTPFTVMFFKDPLSDAARQFIEATDRGIAQQLSPGSPPTLVVTEDGTRMSMNGALPYDLIKEIVDKALAQ